MFLFLTACVDIATDIVDIVMSSAAITIVAIVSVAIDIAINQSDQN